MYDDARSRSTSCNGCDHEQQPTPVLLVTGQVCIVKMSQISPASFACPQVLQDFIDAALPTMQQKTVPISCQATCTQWQLLISAKQSTASGHVQTKASLCKARFAIKPDLATACTYKTTCKPVRAACCASIPQNTLADWRQETNSNCFLAY